MDDKGNFNEEYIEIDLKEYIYILWKNKWTIIGVVLLSVIAAYLYSSIIVTPIYESDAILMTPSYQLINGESFNASEYIQYLKSDKVGNLVKEEYYSDQKYEDIQLQNIFNKLEMNLNNDGRILNLVLAETSPERANNILQFWINEFKKEVNQNVNSINMSYMENLEQKLNNDFNDYENALEEHTQFKQNNNINLLKKQVSYKETRLVSIEREIAKTNNQLKSFKAELKTVDNQLNNTNQFLIQKETISEESLRKLQSLNPELKLIELLTTENQILNPQYDALTTKKNDLEQKISSFNSQLENYKNEVETLNSEIENIQTKISNLEQQETMLLDTLNTTKNNYNNIKRQYNQAQQRLIDNNNQVVTIASPSDPLNASSPNTRLNLAIAFVLGLFLAIFIVFIKQFLKGTDWSEYEDK